ncbi:phosphoserine phosphatase SerB [Frigoribacterium salinisoli]
MPRFLLVLDVDSTLIEDEVIELLAEAAGSRDAVASVTARAMSGQLDFAASLHERVATLAGLPLSAVDEVVDRVRVTPGARELVAGVHAAGGVVAVVSGGFHEVLDPLAADLGLDLWRANRLGVADGRLSGRVEGDVVDAATKAACLRAWAEEASVPLERTVAVGDGANDLLMLEAAQLGVAFDAKPVLRAAADVVLDRRDLSQVLPLLGLRG